MAADINLKKHKQLWEDIEDVLVSQSASMRSASRSKRSRWDLIKSGELRGWVAWLAFTISGENEFNAAAVETKR